MNTLSNTAQPPVKSFMRRPSSRQGFALPLVRAVKVLLRKLFRILPFPVSLFTVNHVNRRLCHLLPPGHTTTFCGYYRSLRVRVNTTYPIERQMLSGIYDASTICIL